MAGRVEEEAVVAVVEDMAEQAGRVGAAADGAGSPDSPPDVHALNFRRS
ncbi:hypothetical protein [Acetanaerobacterium elongatum]|uniref:Uncharacterized protein n=1 Tax=Acetanaerobacterium elongatum TaxID=258515 RepID=A0A1H0FBF7_9FIRM|nr:hypothetical protein [Acetanaerobacterium elongatum]SDN92028.1 hypothetical protein SAMN05192585_13911 [Acetanaerobacterium elongatum]